MARVIQIEGHQKPPLEQIMKTQNTPFFTPPRTSTKSRRRLRNEVVVFSQFWFTPLSGGSTTVICDDPLAAELVNFIFGHPFVANEAATNPPLRLGDGLGVSFEIPTSVCIAKRLCRRFVTGLTDERLQRQIPPMHSKFRASCLESSLFNHIANVPLLSSLCL